MQWGKQLIKICSVYYQMKFSARPLFQLIFRRANASLSSNEFIILGIESSCDDTGVGVVSSRGSILADSRHSQLPWHLLLV